ncbi:MAG TPA: hypothetical protein VMT51_01300 [Dongiaceae bacterium]|nr:hypothetical protein [Dongiaceae bacterium]
MEKQLSNIGYWLGLLCTVIAVILRLMSAMSKTSPLFGPGNAISYLTFFHGAGLCFLLTIASWCRIPKT